MAQTPHRWQQIEAIYRAAQDSARIGPVVFAFLLVASVGASAAQTAFAQTQDKVFEFRNKPGARDLQEIATMLRTLCDIRQLSMRAAASTLTVRGTPDQLALTSWLVHELDQPVTAQPSVPLAVTTPPPRQFLVAGGSDDIIRVFHLVNTPPAPSQAIQEILTTLRTVAGVEKVSDYTPLTDLVVRGSKAQIALSEYLIKAVDVRSGSVTTSPEFQYTTSDGLDQSVRVFYLAHTSTAQGILEILAALVTVADIQKIFVVIPAGALAIRGSASDIATSGWLIQALDIPATPATSPSARVREYHIPGTVSGGNVISVFYPDTTTRVQFRTLGLVRNKLQIRKAFSLISPPALIVRGSPDQIAKARQLIQDGAGAAKTAR